MRMGSRRGGCCRLGGLRLRCWHALGALEGVGLFKALLPCDGEVLPSDSGADDRDVELRWSGDKGCQARADHRCSCVGIKDFRNG